jgi:hypothetical protein
MIDAACAGVAADRYAAMTNSIAIALLVLILGLFALDQSWLHWDLPLLAARSVDDFIEHVSFWR